MKPVSNNSAVFVKAMMLALGATGAILLACSAFETELNSVKAVIYTLRFICFPLIFLAIGWWVSRQTDLGAIFSRKSLVIVSAILAVTLVGLKLLRFHTLNYDLFDLGLYFHQIWRINDQHTLADKLNFALSGHYHPSLLFYSAVVEHLGFSSLLVLQTLTIQLSAIPIFLLSRQSRHGTSLSAAIAVAFIMIPALHFCDILGFHPDHLIVPAICWMFFAIRTSRVWLFYLALFAGISAGEQWMPSLAVICGYAALTKGTRIHGLSGAAVVLAIFVWYMFTYKLELFGPELRSNDQSLDYFLPIGQNYGDHLAALITPRKVFFFGFMFAPLIPLIGTEWRKILLIGPETIKFMLSSEPLHYAVEGHYTFAIIAIVFCIAAEKSVDAKGPKGRFSSWKRWAYLLPFLYWGQAVGHGALPNSINFVTHMSGGAFNAGLYVPNEAKTRLQNQLQALDIHPDRSVHITNEAFVPTIAGRMDFGHFDPTGSMPDYIVIGGNLTGGSGSSRGDGTYKAALEKFMNTIPHDLGNPATIGSYIVIDTGRDLNPGTGEKE